MVFAKPSCWLMLPFASLAFQWPLCVATAPRNSGPWTLAATGDLIGDIVATNDTRTAAVWNITQAADFAFFNMEGQIINEETFTGYPASENGGDNFYGGGGGGPYYPPEQAALLAKYGFNLASHANNHAWDFVEAGMISTHENLAKVGISTSGSGIGLNEARRAVFVTKGNRRLALVSAAGTHTPQSVAGPGDPDEHLRPRPGVSVLRATPFTVVDAAGFDQIRNIAKSQGQILAGDETSITLYTGQTQIVWSNWMLGEESGSSISWDINPDDYTGILDAIKEAKKQSDATIFSLHAHESESGAADSDIPLPPASSVPASYTRNISHAAIDAGADVVLIHGPHTLRGTEVYNSRPIFYGLGSLTYSLGPSFREYNLPIEWDDGMITETKFENGSPAEVVLHPLVHNQLTSDTSLPDRTMPKVAPAAEAQRILAHLQKASKLFGTEIVVKDNVGHIKII
ncbi:unnamed protein product [Clonostachys rosea f. rosea IK726]|uniref:Uncharacterized protein n=1 Tax=Clonostachys rosea f. rosea IK726 TaxID=1349383 RepID=A0ACA9UBG2_BIOOC|nr:unnamed protein product [Clonostachys rosea f. rosea IK726]